MVRESASGKMIHDLLQVRKLFEPKLYESDSPAEPYFKEKFGTDVLGARGKACAIGAEPTARTSCKR